MDGVLHQDLNCRWGLHRITGPKQITINCPRVSCRLVETHCATCSWRADLIWLLFFMNLPPWKSYYTEDKILLQYRKFSWSSPLLMTSFWWMGFPDPEGRLLSCDLFLSDETDGWWPRRKHWPLPCPRGPSAVEDMHALLIMTHDDLDNR